jgi:hypothetical protein
MTGGVAVVLVAAVVVAANETMSPKAGPKILVTRHGVASGGWLVLEAAAVTILVVVEVGVAIVAVASWVDVVDAVVADTPFLRGGP